MKAEDFLNTEGKRVIESIRMASVTDADILEAYIKAIKTDAENSGIGTAWIFNSMTVIGLAILAILTVPWLFGQGLSCIHYSDQITHLQQDNAALKTAYEHDRDALEKKCIDQILCECGEQ